MIISVYSASGIYYILTVWDTIINKHENNYKTQQEIKNNYCLSSVQFSSVQSLSRVRLFVTPWIPARQASLSITNSRSSLRLMSIDSVMPSSHLILCRPLLLLPPVPPSTRVFSNESTLCLRWPKYRSFSFSIIPSRDIPGLISFRMDWLDLLAVPNNYICINSNFEIWICPISYALIC